MRGCFVLIVGLVLGAGLLAAAEVFLIAPPATPLTAPARYDVRIELANQYLTRQVQARASSSSVAAPLHGLTVQSNLGDQVVVSGNAMVGGTSVPAQILVRPAVSQNRVVLQVVRANLGGLPLPGGLFQSLEDSVNRQIALMVGTSSYRIVDVSTTQNGVQVDLALTGA